jgi:ATP-binding cassette subfamily C protein CydC
LRADVDALESLYLRVVAPLITGGVTICLAALFVARWDGSAALALLAVLLVAGVALPLLARRLAAEPGRAATERAGELRALVTEGLQGSEELILFGAVDRQADRVDGLSTALVVEQERLGGIGGLALAGSVACSGIGVAAQLVACSRAVADGRITGPALVMLLLFGAAVFEAAALLPAALRELPATRAAVRRLWELADAPPPLPDPAVPASFLPTAGIAFRDVSCAHTPGLPVLERFNLEVGTGERVALVGPSGIGKSTVAEILLRFRDYRGSVTVGGAELCTLAAADLLEQVSALPQRPHLFNTTVGVNILLGNPAADAATLQKALEDAGLAEWVERLPRGLETPVGEGGSAVSGGEARRIALARALLKDAPILILDEPTEGLDAATEREVVARLAERTRGKTLLVITHRPACLALADRVVRLG